MYKVFFKDRIVFFEEDFQSSIRKNTGLFYKYGNKKELEEIVLTFFKLEKIPHLYLFNNDINKLRRKFISCFTLIKASGGLVKRANGDFLVMKRNDVWDLPKGKKDRNERSKKTAIREVTEECGLNGLTITREIIKTYHTYTLNDAPVLKETTWYEMVTIDNKTPLPQLTEGISEIRWVKPGETAFITQNTYPSVIEVLKSCDLL